MSTEAHALRFLHSTGLDLPIPRLICFFILAGTTYTVMQQVKGEMLSTLKGTLDKETQRTIVPEVDAMLRTLATIPQPLADRGKVMLSPSGHDVPDPVHFFEERCGPFYSKLDCWTYVLERYNEDEFNQVTDGDTRRILEAELIAYVHTNLRMYNVLVYNGHVSAVIDWEDSGWFPASWQVHTMRWLTRFGCSGGGTCTGGTSIDSVQSQRRLIQCQRHFSSKHLYEYCACSSYRMPLFHIYDYTRPLYKASFVEVALGFTIASFSLLYTR